MAEGDIRQLESLQRTLVDVVKVLQADLARSSKTVEAMPGMIQASIQNLTQKLQDQIDFQGEMEMLRTQATLVGKQTLLSEEKIYLEEKKGQLQGDIDRLMKKYVTRQKEYDAEVKQRVLKLDSHVNGILDHYCDRLMPLKFHQDDDLDMRLNTAGATALARRREFVREKLSRHFESLLDFLNKRKALAQQIQESQSAVKVTEKTSIYLPFIVVARKGWNPASGEGMTVLLPGRLRHNAGDRQGITLKIEESPAFTELTNLVTNRVKAAAAQKRLSLKPPHLMTSLKRGLAKLKIRDFFAAGNEALMSDLNKHYGI